MRTGLYRAGTRATHQAKAQADRAEAALRRLADAVIGAHVAKDADEARRLLDAQAVEIQSAAAHP